MKAGIRFLSFVFLLFLLFAFGFGWRDIRQGRLPTAATYASLLTTAVNSGRMSPEQEFSDTYDKIRNDYYKAVPADKLTYAGMEGLMASLGDPHTMFLEPRLAAEFGIDTTAQFVGVGAKLSPHALGAKAVQVFDGGPAAHAGLKVGDIITGVDGKSVVGTSIDDIVSKIRGEEGTAVKLRIIHTDSKEPVTIVATREPVETPTVSETKVVPGTQFGYFQVATFSEPTATQFDTELAKLEKQNIKGLIIDLRDNPGGLLDTAKEMLGRFVENRTVVTVRLRGGREQVENTPSGEKHDFNYPVVILINEDSASAAEIFSGVLQDYRLATLVGTHSYGKASVQNVIPLTFLGGSSAKITIAHYFLPSGRDIGRKVDEDGQFISGGLQPDVKVDLDLYSSKEVTLGDIKTDSQLQKAVEVLKEKTGG